MVAMRFAANKHNRCSQAKTLATQTNLKRRMRLIYMLIALYESIR